MSRTPFRLKSTIGRSYRVDPDDTRRTKKTLRELGYYETPSYGITPYPDEPMFRGIEDLQNDFDLYRDGIMNPVGETVAKLNEVLDFKGRVSKANAKKQEIRIRRRFFNLHQAKTKLLRAVDARNNRMASKWLLPLRFPSSSMRSLRCSV